MAKIEFPGKRNSIRVTKKRKISIDVKLHKGSQQKLCCTHKRYLKIDISKKFDGSEPVEIKFPFQGISIKPSVRKRVDRRLKRCTDTSSSVYSKRVVSKHGLDKSKKAPRNKGGNGTLDPGPSKCF